MVHLSGTEHVCFLLSSKCDGLNADEIFFFKNTYDVDYFLNTKLMYFLYSTYKWARL